MHRPDGSIKSEGDYLGEVSGKLDFSIYRCMVTAVNYIDDPDNITLNALNPQVTYNVIVIGGRYNGAAIDNVRASSFLGGQHNYSERIFRAATSDPEKRNLESQDGDIVFVGFMGGSRNAPFILGGGTQPLDRDNTGARRSEGPRARMEYNGIFFEVDRAGDFTLRRKGGALNSDSNVFIPDQTGNKLTLKVESQKLTIVTEGGAKVTVDGAADEILAEDKAGGKIKLTGGTFAAGTSSIELLQKISDQLAALNTLFSTVASHKHVGNLGFFTAVPDTQSDWNTAASTMNSIKSDIDSIKGSL